MNYDHPLAARGPARIARHGLLQDGRGTALIEMAITLPVLLALLFGIMAYGEWFFVSHMVQQTANNAARSAVSGLTKDERFAIAQKTVNTNVTRGSTLDGTKLTLVVEDDNASVVVRLSYNAASDPLLSLGFVPMPSTTIRRSAAMLLGGV